MGEAATANPYSAIAQAATAFLNVGAGLVSNKQINQRLRDEQAAKLKAQKEENSQQIKLTAFQFAQNRMDKRTADSDKEKAFSLEQDPNRQSQKFLLVGAVVLLLALVFIVIWLFRSTPASPASSPSFSATPASNLPATPTTTTES